MSAVRHDVSTYVRHLEVGRLDAGRRRRVLLVTQTTSAALVAVRHAHRFLPPFVDGDQEHVEASWLHSGLGLLGELLQDRPFRAPHHSVSPLGMVGSSHLLYADHVLSRTSRRKSRTFADREVAGWRLLPGEVSLAHGGTLLLDAVDEFHSSALDLTLDALRDGHVDHVRSYGRARVPAKPVLVVATMYSDQVVLSARARSVLERLVRLDFSVVNLKGVP